MTYWEKRSQAISFAVNNVLLDRPAYERRYLWEMLVWAANAHDSRSHEVAEHARAALPLRPKAIELRRRAGRVTTSRVAPGRHGPGR